MGISMISNLEEWYQAKDAPSFNPQWG